MATKTKPRKKSATKARMTASVRNKSKAAKRKSAKAARRSAASVARKQTKVVARKPRAKRQVRYSSPAHESGAPLATNLKPKSKEFTDAVHAYEIGLKLMHAEHYDKAIKNFKSIIDEYSDEPEIQDRARVLLHAAQLKLQEGGRTVLKSADDYYNMGIAELNRRELDAAVQHFQHALKLAPKAEHILYAMAATNALLGHRDQALSYLKQSIHYRPENRFLAVRDSDFEMLLEDEDFKQLVTPTER
jgi:tetratricopeptide (TPR) repeat protein